MLSLPRSPVSSLLGILAGTGVLAVATSAHAVDPILRHQEDLHGDVAVFGNTLAYDCGAGFAPPDGSFASCGTETNTSDTAPDLYWRDGIADASVTPAQARTSATLSLPVGAKVTYARLYWAAIQKGPPAADMNAVLDWLGGPQQAITADASWTIPYNLPAHPDYFYYQSTGDATSYVSQWGAGDFRVSDVDALTLAGQDFDLDRAFSAWTLVVFYEAPGEELRNLGLFDGFTGIDPQVEASASVTLDGFLVPPGFTAKMTAFTYEGDAIYTGDHFTMNDTQATDASNPADNFFNSSRSYLGAPVSGAFDVPKLSGAPGVMAGYDLDTIDVTSRVNAGDTSAVIGADSSYDIFFLGGFITSVTNLSPFFSPLKTVTDLDGGAVVPGDILEYSIVATNTGNDDASSVVLTDVIETGLDFVPGSIEVLQIGNTGAKTDAMGDDEAEYVAASRTLTVRLGEGATAQEGGQITVGKTFEVRFRVKVKALDGVVSNQAVVAASGGAGSPEKTYLSDGDPATVTPDPTVIDVGQCDTDDDCPESQPHCNQSSHACEPCVTDGDCSDPALPACLPNGTCGECTETNTTLCVGESTLCDTVTHVCVFCIPGADGNALPCVDSTDGPVCVPGMGDVLHCGCFADSDCGDSNSGKVCDTVPQLCIDGCRGTGGNGCADGFECTSKDTTIGQCIPVQSTGSDGADDRSGDDGSCACRTANDDSGPGGGLFAFGLGAAALLARRKKAASRG